MRRGLDAELLPSFATVRRGRSLLPEEDEAFRLGANTVPLLMTFSEGARLTQAVVNARRVRQISNLERAKCFL